MVTKGRSGGLEVNLDPVLNYTRTLASANVRPLYSWSYTPPGFEGPGGSWNSGPEDLGLWKEAHASLARGLRGTGAMHEIYNVSVDVSAARPPAASISPHHTRA